MHIPHLERVRHFNSKTQSSTTFKIRREKKKSEGGWQYCTQKECNSAIGNEHLGF